MANSKIISVIGAGYVGLTTAVLLSEAGHKVHLIDVDPKRVRAIKKGRSFFYENGINPLIKHSLRAGLLLPTTQYKPAVTESNFVFSCVGTPDNPDGSSNLSYVFAAAKEALEYMQPGTIYIQKSTVPVGTGDKINQIFSGNSGSRISYVSNPEFLREGTAIADSLSPDRVVIGTGSPATAKEVVQLHKDIEKTAPKIARRAGLHLPSEHKTEYFMTGLSSAELIKVTANAFLALKISFANSIARLSDKTGADINEIMDAVGSDKRIGRAFLNAGRGYGGGCFPKDVSGLITSAAEHGVDLQIMTAASDVNDAMPDYIAHKAKEALDGLSNKRMAVLGLAFKAGTSDARRSPGVRLANLLAKAGARVYAFDPKANEEAKPNLAKDVRLVNSVDTAVSGSWAIFITTDWPEFISLNLGGLNKAMAGNLLVDCVNSLDKKSVQAAGFDYLGVGR